MSEGTVVFHWIILPVSGGLHYPGRMYEHTIAFVLIAT